MTKVTYDFGEEMQKEAVLPVSSDVNFASDRFPEYKIGPDNIIIEAEDSNIPSLREIVAKETALLLDQQKRLSVRDLAKKFENGLTAVAELSQEVSMQNFGLCYLTIYMLHVLAVLFRMAPWIRLRV